MSMRAVARKRYPPPSPPIAPLHNPTTMASRCFSFIFFTSSSHPNRHIKAVLRDAERRRIKRRKKKEKKGYAYSSWIMASLDFTRAPPPSAEMYMYPKQLLWLVLLPLPPSQFIYHISTGSRATSFFFILILYCVKTMRPRVSGFDFPSSTWSKELKIFRLVAPELERDSVESRWHQLFLLLAARGLLSS